MGVQIAHAKGQFLGERTCPGMPNNSAMSCAKMAELMEKSFGLWTRVGPRSMQGRLSPKALGAIPPKTI